MSTPILATKLFIPPPRTKIVLRPHLIERLNAGLAAEHKLSLISAPAGFGKTTLVSEWIAGCGRPVTWLSLDEGDNDPSRFLSYVIAALQTIKADIGAGLLGALQSPQPPSTEAVLTALLNEITTVPDQFILVLDDYRRDLQHLQGLHRLPNLQLGQTGQQTRAGILYSSLSFSSFCKKVAVALVSIVSQPLWICS